MLLSLMLLSYILTEQDLIIGMKYISWQFQMLETAESKFLRSKKHKKQKTGQTKNLYKDLLYFRWFSFFFYPVLSKLGFLKNR